MERKKKFSTEVKVGIFLIIIFLLIAWISFKLESFKWGGKGYTLSALFDSAAGLDPEASVYMAGIRIGRIHAIQLEGGKARVYIRIFPHVKIAKNSLATVQSRGLLGAKYIDIMPGDPKIGLLKDGDEFTNIRETIEITKLAGDFDAIAQDVKKVTEQVSAALGTPEAQVKMERILENLERISESLAALSEANQENFTRLVDNLTMLSENMYQLSERSRADLEESIAAMPEIVKNLQQVTSVLANSLSQNQEGLSKALANLEDATTRLNESLEAIASISRKIDEGEGTIGKLVNDPRPIEKAEEAIEGINELVGRIKRAKAVIDIHSEYMFDAQDAKTYLSLLLYPTLDKYYLLGVVDDPVGQTKITHTKTKRVINPGEDDEQTIEIDEEKEVVSEELKINLQLAKRFWDVVLRGGILESTGGVGFDVYLFEDRIKLFAEAFDWSVDANPHLKVGASLRILSNIMLYAGADDVIDEERQYDYYLGLGLMFTDEDLLTFLGSISSVMP